MSKLDHFIYFAFLLTALVAVNNLARERTEAQTTLIGDYTKYVAEQIIEKVEHSCNAPNT